VSGAASAIPRALAELCEELGRLPGIGPKSAQRIAFHLLRVPERDALRLADAVVQARQLTRLCARCFAVAEDELCPVCADPGRDPSVLFVVEDPRDVLALERTGQVRGRYHVLHGALSPIDGVGVDRLKIAELFERLRAEAVREVVLCTNPTLEGEATAMYLARQLRPEGMVVTRLASGLPVGGDLEYADELTLSRALEGRRALDA
jgi:recombination protein RecR